MSYKNPKIKIFILVVLFILAVSLIFAIFYGNDFDSYELSQDNTKKNSAKAVQEDASVQELKTSNQEAIEKAKKVVLGNISPVTEQDYFIGSTTSPVEMIVYCDFKSKLCADYQSTINSVKKEFGGQVLIVFRHFYLSNNNYSYSAALATECAGEQGKFFEMGTLLLEDYLNNVSSDYLAETAVKLELNLQDFNKCFKTEKYSEKISEQIQDAKKSGVLGVPSTFINGEKIPGNYSFDDFRDSSGRDREGVKSVILKKLKK